MDFDHYFPLIKDNIVVEFKQKRTCLNMYIDAYETKIQQYQHQYDIELHKFQRNCHSTRTNTNDETMTIATNLFNSFLNYINYRTNRMIQKIAFEKIPIYRKQVLRRHH